MSYNHIPNVNSMADLIDRLIVCVNKLSFFEMKKREEHAKPRPDNNQIALWDNRSRDQCEIRDALKREIDATLTRAINNNEYKVLPDFRTFRAPDKTIADILADQCDEIGVATKQKLEEYWG